MDKFLHVFHLYTKIITANYVIYNFINCANDLIKVANLLLSNIFRFRCTLKKLAELTWCFLRLVGLLGN